MLDWDYLSAKIETALSQAVREAPQTPSFFDVLGMTTMPPGVNSKTASKIATAAIRDDVESYISRIPRVPTNKYDLAITFGVLGITAAGMYLFYRVMMNEPSYETSSSK